MKKEQPLPYYFSQRMAKEILLLNKTKTFYIGYLSYYNYYCKIISLVEKGKIIKTLTELDYAHEKYFVTV